MKRMIVFVLVFSWLFISCATSHIEPVIHTDDKLDEILARGTLIIATDADYAPQSKLLKDISPAVNTKCEPAQYTANQFEGFDVEVAVEIAKHLGVEPCFVTPPYYATPTVVLIHKENKTYKVPEDLSGMRIGVCVGCTFEDYLKGVLKMPGENITYRIHNAQIIGYENEDPAIEDLSLGDGVKLDAVITLLPIAEEAIASETPVKIMSEPLLFSYASVTMDRSGKRDVASLLTKINGIIKELHNTGSLRQLSEKYQGHDLTRQAAIFDLSILNQLP